MAGTARAAAVPPTPTTRHRHWLLLAVTSRPEIAFEKPEKEGSWEEVHGGVTAAAVAIAATVVPVLARKAAAVGRRKPGLWRGTKRPIGNQPKQHFPKEARIDHESLRRTSRFGCAVDIHLRFILKSGE